MVVYPNRNRHRTVHLASDVMVVKCGLSILLSTTRTTGRWIATRNESPGSRFRANAVSIFANATLSRGCTLIRGYEITNWQLSFHSPCLRVEGLERQDTGRTLAVQRSEVG